MRYVLFICLFTSLFSCVKLDDDVQIKETDQLLSRVNWKEGSVEGYGVYSYENGKPSRIDWHGDRLRVLGEQIDYTTFEYDSEGKITQIIDYYNGGIAKHRKFIISYENGLKKKIDYNYYSRINHGTTTFNLSRTGTEIGEYSESYWDNYFGAVYDQVGNKRVRIQEIINSQDLAGNIYFRKGSPLVTFHDTGWLAWGSFKHYFEDTLDVSQGAKYVYVKMRSKRRDIVPVSIAMYDGVRFANSDAPVHNVNKDWGIYTFSSDYFFDGYNSAGNVDQTHIVGIQLYLDPAGMYDDEVEFEWILVGPEKTDVSNGLMSLGDDNNDPKVVRNHFGKRASVSFEGTENWLEYAWFLPEAFGGGYYGGNVSFKGLFTYEYVNSTVYE